MIIKGAIFDVDGTLLDTMPMWHHAGARYLQGEGFPFQDHLGDIFFSMTLEEVATYIIENYGLAKPKTEIMKGINRQVEDFYANEAQPKEGAMDMLEALKAEGIPMTVATSTDRYCIESAFERLGMSGYFKKLFTCTEVGASKNNPAIFFEAVTEMGSPIDLTWVFEDGLYAMKTAKKEGFRIAGVYDAISEKDQKDIMQISDIYMTSLTQFNLL